ncbi:hypothetical protein IAR55_002556 [Kwoniella newhampshirensis]|uniref:Uncharacterized protein n=1 Tax=Kwoniella newhampshirensis TaxID=1651941 RepID=A0AAW0Z1S6_9TREE
MAVPPPNTLTGLPAKISFTLSKARKRNAKETKPQVANKMKDPSVSQMADQKENKVNKLPKRSADDIRTLLRSFSITTSPKSHNLATPPAEGMSKLKDSEASSSINMPDHAAELDRLPPLPCEYATSSMVSMETARDQGKIGPSQIKLPDVFTSKVTQDDKTDPPLPIGTEKQLGLLNGRSSPRYQEGITQKTVPPQTSLWPPTNCRAFTLPSPNVESTARVDWRRGRGEEDQSRYKVQRGSWSYTRPETWPNKEIWRESRDMFDPFNVIPKGSEQARQASSTRFFAIPIVDTTSPIAEENTVLTEPLNFSDLVTSPGYGGYNALANLRRQSFGSPHPSHRQHPSSQQLWTGSSPEVTDGISHTQLAQGNTENDIINHSPRRFSIPTSVWRQQISQAPAATVAPTGRRSLSHTTGSSSVGDEPVTPDEEQGITPLNRFTTPGPERHGEDGIIIHRTPGSRQSSGHQMHFANSGLLPSSWPEDTHGPPASSPFSPGDWKERRMQVLRASKAMGIDYRGSSSSSNARGVAHPQMSSFDLLYTNASIPVRPQISSAMTPYGRSYDGPEWPAIGPLTASRSTYEGPW